MYRLSACIVLSALLVACSSTPVAPAASPSTVQPNSTSRAGTAPLSAVANVTAAPSGSEDAADLQSGGRSVYFDFDDAVVRPEYFSLVEGKAVICASIPR